jgi:hypothetical protein
MAKDTPELDAAKRLMGALIRMPPKPHEEMKIGKPRAKPAKSPKARANQRTPKKA